MCHFPPTIRSLETAIPWRWERGAGDLNGPCPQPGSTEAWLCPPVDQPPAPPATQGPKAPRPHGRQQRRTPPVTPRRRRTVEQRPPKRQRKRRGVVFSLPMQPRELQVGDLATHGFAHCPAACATKAQIPRLRYTALDSHSEREREPLSVPSWQFPAERARPDGRACCLCWGGGTVIHS